MKKGFQRFLARCNIYLTFNYVIYVMILYKYEYLTQSRMCCFFLHFSLIYYYKKKSKYISITL